MSYSFNNICYRCENKDKCTDRILVEEAINKIHEKCYSEEGGHMGAGEILLLCHNIKSIRE
jgi:hypothetical protein